MTVGGDGRRGVHPRRGRRARASAARGRHGSSSASPAGRGARGEGSGLGLAIVQARSPSATAAASRSTARASRSLSKNSQSPPVELAADEKTPHRILPPPAGDRRRAGGRGRRRRHRPGRPQRAPPSPLPSRSTAPSSTPPTLPPVEGVTARIKFTNNLLPSGSLPADTASPALTGADGPPVAGQRRPAAARAAVGQRRRADRRRRRALHALRRRLEDRLHRRAPAGRASRKADASRRRSPASSAGLAKLGEAWTLSGADADARPPAGRATPCGSRPRTTAACSARPSWPGTPPAACRCAPRSTPRAREDPVLELEATDIAYGTIAGRARSTPRRPRARKVTEIDPPTGVDAQGKPTHVEGVEDVQKRLDFQLSAPDELAGLPRRSVASSAIGERDRRAAASTAQGLGADPRLPAQGRAGQRRARSTALTLPQVNIDGATGHRARHRARHAR